MTGVKTVTPPNRGDYGSTCRDDPGGTRQSEWQFQHWFGATGTLVIIFVTSARSSCKTKLTELMQATVISLTAYSILVDRTTTPLLHAVTANFYDIIYQQKFRTTYTLLYSLRAYYHQPRISHRSAYITPKSSA